MQKTRLLFDHVDYVSPVHDMHDRLVYHNNI
jgi:hypothetical protein